MPDVVRLRRIESGCYVTLDGKYRVERIDSLGEADYSRDGHGEWATTVTWVVTTGGRPDDRSWDNEIHEADTKRECVAWLARNEYSQEG